MLRYALSINRSCGAAFYRWARSSKRGLRIVALDKAVGISSTWTKEQA